MQIPLIIGYHKFMQDLTTFHIWGTICMNQVLNVSKQLETKSNSTPLDYLTTSNTLIENVGSSSGISAMSISDMTNIPRATIIRKCKYLIKHDLVKMNEKKQYVLSKIRNFQDARKRSQQQLITSLPHWENEFETVNSQIGSLSKII